MDAISIGMYLELKPFNSRVTTVASVLKGRPDLSPVVDAIVEAAKTPEPKQRYLVAPGTVSADEWREREAHRSHAETLTSISARSDEGSPASPRLN